MPLKILTQGKITRTSGANSEHRHHCYDWHPGSRCG